MPLGTEVGLDPGDIVLDGDPVAPSPSPLKKTKRKWSTAPISVHVRCGQTAGWIKMPLGMAVGLGPGDFVLDRDPTPPSPQKGGGTQPPIFGPCLL